MYSYVKNKFVKSSKALISIQERGFKFSDGFFDTVLIENYQPYQWHYHKEKIIYGINLLKINITFEEIEAKAKLLIAKNKFKKGLLRISISRGIGSNGYTPKKDITPTLVIETIKVSTTKLANSKLWLSNYHKIPASCLPTNIKTMQGAQSVLAKLEATENNCFESLLLTIEGYIAEGSSSNIFWIKNNKLYAPALTTPVYSGSMRNAIINIAPIEIVEGSYKLEELLAAEEIFICNSAIKIKAINQILPINKKFTGVSHTTKFAKLLDKDIKEKTRLNAW